MSPRPSHASLIADINKWMQLENYSNDILAARAATLLVRIKEALEVQPADHGEDVVERCKQIVLDCFAEANKRSRWHLGSIENAEEVARAVLAEVSPVEGWRPVESVPRDGTPVRLCGHGIYHGTEFVGKYEPSALKPDSPWVNIITRQRLMEHAVTHWQPTSPLPKQEKAG